MANTESSDAEFVQLTLQGEREAFGRLYDRHAVGVRAVVAAVAKDFGAVDDLTQETFTRAYSRLSTLKNPANFRSWLLGVARLVAKERLRELKRKHVSITAGIAPVDSRQNVQSIVDDGDELQRALAQIAMMPEQDRLAIHAYFFAEQNADEAARAIGISRSGFYAVVKRGLARLRNELKDPRNERGANR